MTDASTTESAAGIAPVSEEEFDTRVMRLLAMMDENPELERRVLAEIYVQLSEIVTGFREFQEDFARLGPGGFLKMLRGGGGKKNKHDEEG